MDITGYIDGNMGPFHENQTLYHERSSINRVNEIETPLLLQHGESDLRVPVSQSYELYQALKAAGKEVTLILYPEMKHNITDPNMLLECMQTNLSWFKERI